MFQFHSGSIKTRRRNETHDWNEWFQFHSGSIKTDTLVDQLFNQLQFQFHSGSIKTYGREVSVYMIHEFQFHSGSIKTPRENNWDLQAQRFNSTLVRLKLVPDSYRHIFLWEFQFHSGSIKTSTVHRLHIIFTGVSIPLWFD